MAAAGATDAWIVGHFEWEGSIAPTQFCQLAVFTQLLELRIFLRRLWPVSISHVCRVDEGAGVGVWDAFTPHLYPFNQPSPPRDEVLRQGRS